MSPPVFERGVPGNKIRIGIRADALKLAHEVHPVPKLLKLVKCQSADLFH